MVRLFVRLMLMLWGVSLIALMVARSVDGQPGNPRRGAAFYHSVQLACTECHDVGALSVPPLVGIAARAAEDRLTDPENSGESVALYLAESIIEPDRYHVPGYPTNVMPHYEVGGTFGLSWQDLNDLVAYLRTL